MNNQNFKHSTRTVMLFCLVIFYTAVTQAQIPRTLGYQGILQDAGGTAVQDDNYNITFNLYTAATGGAALWTEIQTVTVVQGLFNVILGSVNPMTLSFDSPYWLGMSVEGSTELDPRIQLTSTAYSFWAIHADSINGISANVTPTPNSLFPLGADSKFPETVLPSGLPPGGTAGGDLTGNYPDPSITENAVTTDKILPDVLSSINNVQNDGGNIDFIAGSNIMIDTDNTAKTITISAAGIGGGDITAVNAGIGLDGGGDTGDVELRVEVPLLLSGNYGYPNSVLSGTNSGGGRGVSGESGSGIGVRGHSSSGMGVYGTSNSDKGVFGEHSGSGNYGCLGSYEYGVYGKTKIASGYPGVFGEGQVGVKGSGSTGITGDGSNMGVYGTGGNIGVKGFSISSTGVYAQSNTGVALYAHQGGDGNYAGSFYGNVQVNGNISVHTLYKTSGAFKIDHPLDPENKYLFHSFIESPDMMNIYNGIITLDASGEAWIELPNYFQVLNKDYRYQLTCIGGYEPVYIAQEVTNNTFKIAGGKSGLKVSWQVTGIRNDPFAREHRIQVEVEKTGKEKGRYLYPEEYGLPSTLGVDYEENQQMKYEFSNHITE